MKYTAYEIVFGVIFIVLLFAYCAFVPIVAVIDIINAGFLLSHGDELMVIGLMTSTGDLLCNLAMRCQILAMTLSIPAIAVIGGGRWIKRRHAKSDGCSLASQKGDAKTTKGD